MGMNWKKAFLALQSALCILLAVLLAVSAIGIYREGSAAKTANPLAWIFTPEAVGAQLRPIAVLLLAVIGMTAVGLALRIRPEGGRSAKAAYVDNKRSVAGAKTWRIVLLSLALLLVLAGIVNGGARDVFGKAVKICTECVGLG